MAKRPEDSGKGMEAAAKEGGQESLISQDPVEAYNSPSADLDLHATHQSPVHADNQGPSDEIDIHNLEVPQVLHLEAPPVPFTPPPTPFLDHQHHFLMLIIIQNYLQHLLCI